MFFLFRCRRFEPFMGLEKVVRIQKRLGKIRPNFARYLLRLIITLVQRLNLGYWQQADSGKFFLFFTSPDFYILLIDKFITTE